MSTGRGIYYNANHVEAQLFENEQVIVVGGGNSAGQAAVLFSQSSSKMHLSVRSGRLSESMSQYLIGRIEENPMIDIHFRTRITGLSPGARLEEVQWTDDGLSQSSMGPIRHFFAMAGAAPRTEWLEDLFLLDERSFIVMGSDILCRLERNQ